MLTLCKLCVGWCSLYATGPTDAASKALLGGSDVDTGDRYFSPRSSGGLNALGRALAEDRVSPDQVNVALSRVLANRFRTGLFDPLDTQVYTKIGSEAVNSTESHRLVLDAALQSLVLLKNDGILPLKRGMKLAVVGPHVISTRDLVSPLPRFYLLLWYL